MNEQTRLARPFHQVPFTADDFLRMMELGAFADMRAGFAKRQTIPIPDGVTARATELAGLPVLELAPAGAAPS